MYHNDPKFSDRYAWTNSADPDQTAPRGAVWSGSTLFAIPSACNESKGGKTEIKPKNHLHLLEALLYGKAWLFKF